MASAEDDNMNVLKYVYTNQMYILWLGFTSYNMNELPKILRLLNTFFCLLALWLQESISSKRFLCALCAPDPVEQIFSN